LKYSAARKQITPVYLAWFVAFLQSKSRWNRRARKRGGVQLSKSPATFACQRIDNWTFPLFHFGRWKSENHCAGSLAEAVSFALKTNSQRVVTSFKRQFGSVLMIGKKGKSPIYLAASVELHDCRLVDTLDSSPFSPVGEFCLSLSLPSQLP